MDGVTRLKLIRTKLFVPTGIVKVRGIRIGHHGYGGQRKRKRLSEVSGLGLAPPTSDGNANGGEVSAAR